MYRIRTTWTGPQGAPYLSTMYFDESAGSAAQAAAAVSTFWAAVDNHIDGLWVWRVENEVALVNDANGQVTGLASVVGGTGAGTAAGDPLPRVAQALVRWRTGFFFGGREVRGRTFIPGVVAVSVSGGVTSTVIAAIDTAAAALIADINCVLEVYSRTNFIAVPAVTGGTWTEFAALKSRRD